MGGRGGRGLRDRRDVPVRRRGAAGHARRSGRPASTPSSRWRSTATRARARAGRRRRRAGGSPTRAPRSSGSTASAARRRCCRCCGRSARRSTCPVAALPVPYRTHGAEPTFQSLGRRRGAFPIALDPFTCTRYDVADVRARRARARRAPTSGCAAARRPTTSARWPRRWAGAARQPLLARHVQARLPRLGPEPAGGEPRVRGAPVAVYRYAVDRRRRDRQRRRLLAQPPGRRARCCASSSGSSATGSGASEDHSRIIRLGYHAPAYTALTPRRLRGLARGRGGVRRTARAHAPGMVNIARRGSEGAEILDAYTGRWTRTASPTSASTPTR